MQPTEVRRPDIRQEVLSNPLSNETQARQFVDNLGFLKTTKGLQDKQVLGRLKSLKTDPNSTYSFLLVQKGVLVQISNLDPKTHPDANPKQIDDIKFYLKLASDLGMHKSEKVKAYLEDVKSTLPKTTKKGLSRRGFLGKGTLAAASVVATGGIGGLVLANKAIDSASPKPDDATTRLRAIAKEATPIPPTATPTATPKPPEPTRAPEPTKTPEVQFNALAKLIGTLPPPLYDVYTGKLLAQDLVKKITTSQTIGIIGYGKKGENNFRCYDPLTKTLFDIPIDRLDVLSGIPVKDMPQLSYFGIRNNDANLMGFAKELGVSKVRIAANNATPDTDQDLKQALERARAQNLDILYVYNPDASKTPAQIETHLRGVISRYNPTIEIGNEPDETENNYWVDYAKSGKSLESFARFVKSVVDTARRIKPDTKLIIGALVEPERNQLRLFQMLKILGVDLSNIRFAVHAYGIEELEKRVKAVQAATGQRNLEITELGFNDNNNSEMLPNLVRRAKRLGMGNVYLHELPQNEKEFGLVNPKTLKRSPKYFYLQKMVIDETENPPSLHSEM